MKTRFIALLILLATTVTLVGTSPTHAQDGSRVRELIEQNGELLETATALVIETNSIKARTSLVTARELHQRSIELLNQGAFAMAARVAFRTREVIQQTIMLAKREARLEEQAQKAIERAGLRLDQARAAVDETESPEPAARRLLQESVENLRQAREQMQGHRFAVALRLADSSISLSMRVLRMLRGEMAATGSLDDVRDEIERTDRALEDAREARSSLPAALASTVDQASDMQRRARQSADAGAAGRAREETLAARELALRAVRAADPAGAGPEGAQAALEMTDDLLMRAGEAVDGTPRALTDARAAQESARRALADGHPDAALKQSMRARELVRPLLADEAAADPRAVEAALTRTDETLARLSEQVAGTGDATTREMLERSRERQAEARRAVADGDPRRALALTRVATRVARDALTRLDEAGR